MLRIWEARGRCCRPSRAAPAPDEVVRRSLCAWAAPPAPLPAASAATRRARAHRQDMLRSLSRDRGREGGR